MNPGLKAAGLDPKMVDQLVEAAGIPVETAKKRKEEVIKEKEEFENLRSKLNELDGTLNTLKSRYDFYKYKLDSSHPDIIDGTVGSEGVLGTYEFEVRSMARTEKELAYGFPDKNDTPVGFGFMLIEREDREPAEIIIEPNSTLNDVVNSINDSDAGVRAIIINTKYKPDPYRLLVISEESGKESKIYLDPDTTFLEFKEQVSGRNLDVLFEDVPVTDNDNSLEDLISGVNLQVKRSEPGTRVQVSILHDIEATVENIKGFVDKYNEVASYINSQFQKDPQTGQYGLLSGEQSIKLVMRQLQSALSRTQKFDNKFQTLAQIGITTEPKTGSLQLDDAKLNQALTDDYDSVANLFIRTKSGVGMADVVADRLKSFRDPRNGAIQTRIKGLQNIIDNQDKDIERRERLLQQKEQSIRQRFSNLGGRLAELKSQGDFLSAKLGGGAKK